MLIWVRRRLAVAKDHNHKTAKWPISFLQWILKLEPHCHNDSRLQKISKSLFGQWDLIQLAFFETFSVSQKTKRGYWVYFVLTPLDSQAITVTVSQCIEKFEVTNNLLCNHAAFQKMYMLALFLNRFIIEKKLNIHQV